MQARGHSVARPHCLEWPDRACELDCREDTDHRNSYKSQHHREPQRGPGRKPGEDTGRVKTSPHGRFEHERDPANCEAYVSQWDRGE